MYNKHGYLGTVLARVEHLGRLKGTGIKTFDLYLSEDGRVKGRSSEVTMVNDAGGEEGSKLVEDLSEREKIKGAL